MGDEAGVGGTGRESVGEAWSEVITLYEKRVTRHCENRCSNLDLSSGTSVQIQTLQNDQWPILRSMRETVHPKKYYASHWTPRHELYEKERDYQNQIRFRHHGLQYVSFFFS